MIHYSKDKNIVRDSEPTDIAAMDQRLRQSDINEVWASHHHSPEQALKLSYLMSEKCFTIEIAGKPEAMFGITAQSIVSDSAIVWLLATDNICKIKTSFVRESKRFVHYLLKQYPLLENYVDARNRASIIWLKRCGAKLEEAKPYGLDNLLFHHFTFRRS